MRRHESGCRGHLVVMDHRDAEAFRRLYRRHYGCVVRFLSSRTPRGDVDALAAETFRVAWRRAGHVPGDQLPWLLNIAARCLADRRRGGERREAIADRL